MSGNVDSGVGPSILSYPFRAVLNVYSYLGLLAVVSRERYIHFRPADVFILDIFVGLSVVIGIPFFAVMWLFGLIALSGTWFSLMVLAMFFVPLPLTLSVLELMLLRVPKR